MAMAEIVVLTPAKNLNKVFMGSSSGLPLVFIIFLDKFKYIRGQYDPKN